MVLGDRGKRHLGRRDHQRAGRVGDDVVAEGRTCQRGTEATQGRHDPTPPLRAQQEAGREAGTGQGSKQGTMNPGEIWTLAIVCCNIMLNELMVNKDIAAAKWSRVITPKRPKRS